MHVYNRDTVHYDAGAIYAARRAVTIGGHHYTKGDPIPRECAKDERQYFRWWDTRLLEREPYAGELPEIPASSAPAAQPVPKGMVDGQKITSNDLIDAAAAAAAGQQAPQAPQVPLGDLNEGFLEPKGRGWFVVHFREVEPARVRGVGAASDKLNEFRVAAGLAPIAGEAKEDTPAAPPAPVPLQVGDEVVDGDGVITTVTAADLPRDPITEPWGDEDENGNPLGVQDGPDDESPRNPPEA
jgi:hypothetical protein